MKTILKKLLQCILLLMLSITAIPCISINAEDTREPIAYTIDANDQRRDLYTIKEAMEASYTTYGIYMCSDWIVNSTIDVPENKTSTIRMEGYIIIRTESDTKKQSRFFHLRENSSLHLTGSKTYTTYTFGDNQEVSSGGLLTNGYQTRGGAFRLEEGSSLYLTDVAVAGNRSATKSYGGAIYVEGNKANIYLDGAKIYKNTTSKNGGAIYVNGENCNIELKNNSIISNNRSYGAGGGIYVDKEKCAIKMDNSSISSNTSNGSGAGIFVNDTNFTLEMENNSIIEGNNSTSSADGMAIYFNYSWFNVFSNGKKAYIRNHSCYVGGAIYINSQYLRSDYGTINGITFENNQSISEGGALYVGQNNITIKNCTFTNNESTSSGGGAIDIAGKDNVIEDTTITNNKAEKGGGVSVDASRDLTLKGTVKIYNNTNQDGKDDDVYLNDVPAFGAYILSNEINLDSLVGIKTNSSSDRKLVKNLKNFSYGGTFFLDDGTSLHLDYQSGEEELWQRKGVTTYRLYIDNDYTGKYEAGSKVTITKQDTNGKVFKNWSATNITQVDDVNSRTTTLTMPSYDLYLTSDSVSAAANLELYIDYPEAGKTLDSKATLKYNVNDSKEFEITWYKVGQETTVLGDNYQAVANEEYIPQVKLSNDISKNLYLNSNISASDVKIYYGSNVATATTFKYFANETLLIVGEKVGVDDNTISSINPITIKVSSYIKENALVDAINKQITSNGVKVYTNAGKEYTLKFDELSESDKTTISSWYQNGNIIVPTSGYYTLVLESNNTDELNLGNNKGSLRIEVLTDNTVTKVDDINVSINKGAYISVLKNAIPNQVQVTTKDNKKYIVDVDKSDLDTLLSPITNGDVTKLLDDGGNKLSICLPLTSKDTIKFNDKSLNVNITVNDINTGKAIAIPHIPCGGLYAMPTGTVVTSLQEDIATIEVTNDEYKFDEEGNFYVKATCEDNEASIYYQVNGGEPILLEDSEGWVKLGSDKIYTLAVYSTKNTEDGTLTSSTVTSIYILDGDYYEFTFLEKPSFSTKEDTYIPNDEGVSVDENGNMSLNVTFKESSFNIKYFINDDTSTVTYDKNGGITITCPKDELKVYTITAWTEDEDGSSECITGTFILDNRGLDESKLFINTDIVIDIPTANKNLATSAIVSGNYLGSTFNKEDVTVTWSTNDTKAIYDNEYLATLNIDSMFENATNKQDIIDMINVSVKDTNNTLINGANAWAELENDKIVLKVLFPKTESFNDPRLEFTLKNITTTEYIKEISYEDALKINNDFTNYDLPYVILNTVDSNDISYNFKEDASSLYKVVTAFNPNNYDAQEIVIEANVKDLIPSYIINNNLNTKITLRIKVKAKQGYIPNEVIEESTNKAITCEEYMKSKDWTWSESKKACVYKVSNTGSN